MQPLPKSNSSAILATICVLCSTVGAYAQSNRASIELPATLTVRVLDSQNHPHANVQVRLIDKRGIQLTERTGPDGRCRFHNLSAGSYRLSPSGDGFEQASALTVDLAASDNKEIELTLPPAQKKYSLTRTPEFFDDPKFTAAGVTDTSNLGGHGSTVRVPTSEALSRATVSLKSETPKSLSAESVRELRQQADGKPADFDLNYRAGESLLASGHANEAIPYLQRAQRIRTDDPNTYLLARAYSQIGDHERARELAKNLLGRSNTAEAHHLLATIEEKAGNPLDANREFQRAAELDPNETNLFDWGSELLLHHALPQATQVFEKGHQLFPKSQHILLGFAATKYSSGDDEQGAKLLCEASDLDPANATPYEFMGRILSTGSPRSDEISARLARFVQLQPENAAAKYYYALSLWQGNRVQANELDSKKIETLLENAVRLDPKLGPAYLQLGILYADRGKTARAVPLLAKATELTPDLPDAHYRLSRAYSLLGEKDEAQHEFALYQQTSKAAEAELQRQRREVQQLVFTMQSKDTISPH
jgi:tetratricopeptide (TPR) repeat protein